MGRKQQHEVVIGYNLQEKKFKNTWIFPTAVIFIQWLYGYGELKDLWVFRLTIGATTAKRKWLSEKHP